MKEPALEPPQLIVYPVRECFNVAAWRAGWRRDAYRCDGEASEQTELRARGAVDRRLGLQQAELQEPNGWDDGAEVEENHGGKPKKKKKKPPKEGNEWVFFRNRLFFFFFCHTLK